MSVVAGRSPRGRKRNGLAIGRGSRAVAVTVASLLLVGGLTQVAASADTTTVTTFEDLQAAFAAGGTVTLGADITAPDQSSVAVGPNQSVTLDLSGHQLSITSPADSDAAVGVGAGQSLTIEDTAVGGGGTLTTVGGIDASAIGGSQDDADSGDITISGGSVTATGGDGGGAGIGGSNGGSADGSLTITGGTVSATGGEAAAGIGGGVNGSGGSVVITGGTVSAVGGVEGAGIGGGVDGNSGAVTISGGMTNARGGGYAAGIGGGYSGSAGPVTISGGTVSAVGGYQATGIGGGYYGSGGTVVVSSPAMVTADAYFGLAIGPGSGGSGYFGSLSNSGSLTIGSDDPRGGNLYVPPGTTVLNSGTLTLLGMVVKGRLVGKGTVVNDGVILGGQQVAGNGQGNGNLLVTNHNYTLNFDTQGADSSTPAALHIYAATISAAQEMLPASPTKSGSTFTGWFTAATGGTQVTNGTDLPSALAAVGPATAKLYAQYAQNTAANISGTPPGGSIDSAYSFTFTTTGSPAPTVSVTAGSLPAGLTLSASGVLSGTPTTTGSSTFTVTADNGVGAAASEQVTVAVTGVAPGAPTAVTATAGNNSADVSWTAPTFTGGSAISGYTVTGKDTTNPSAANKVTTVTGSVTMTTVTGLTAGDAYTFTVTATNGAGTSAPSAPSNAVTPYSNPTITGTPPGGTVGTAYSFTFTTSGSPKPTESVTAGLLPAGLVLSTSGTLSGSPTTAGSYMFTVTADNKAGTPASEQVTVVISGASTPVGVSTVTPTSGSGQSATAGQPFSSPLIATVTDSNGNPVAGVPVTFAVTEGSAAFGKSASVTVTTSSSGVATAPTMTAGTNSGPVTITASSGIATPATFSESVTPAPASTRDRADLQVTISAPSNVARSGYFDVTVTVKNNGPATVSKVVTLIALGNGITVANASGCTVKPGAVFRTTPSLASSATTSYTLKLRAGSRPVKTGLLASTLSATIDPRLFNNIAGAAVRVS